MARQHFDDTDVKRGLRLRNIRKKVFSDAGRDAVAMQLGGFSGSTLQNWEDGKPIANTALTKILEAGVSLKYLLTGEGPMIVESASSQKQVQYPGIISSNDAMHLMKAAKGIHSNVHTKDSIDSIYDPEAFERLFLEKIILYLPDSSSDVFASFFGVDEETAELFSKRERLLSITELGYFCEVYRQKYAGLEVDTNWLLSTEPLTASAAPVFVSISTDTLSVNGKKGRLLGIYQREILFLAVDTQEICKIQIDPPFPVCEYSTIVPFITWSEILHAIPNPRYKPEWRVRFESECTRDYHFRWTEAPSPVADENPDVETSGLGTNQAELALELSEMTANLHQLYSLMRDGEVSEQDFRQVLAVASGAVAIELKRVSAGKERARSQDVS